MSYPNEDELMEQYIDALMHDMNAPVPNGLDEELAAFTRKLVLSQATYSQRAQPTTSQPVAAKQPRITVMPAERRSTPILTGRSRTSYLTAIAAGLIMVIFVALLWTALNPKNDTAQPGTTYTPATQNININVTVNVTTTGSQATVQTATCSAGMGQSAPTIEVDSTALASGENTLTMQIEPQLLDYLNTVGSAERLAAQLNTLTGEPNLNSQVFTLDISGDTTAEILILFPAAMSENSFVGGLFVFSCENGRYVASHSLDVSGFRLGTDEAPLAEVVSSYPQIISIRDMNADAVPEIVYTHLWQRDDPATAVQAYDIYQWDGKRLVNLTATNATPMIRAIRPKAEMRNTNADSTLELVIESNATLSDEQRNDFERNWQQIWGWDVKTQGSTDWNTGNLLCKRAIDAPVYRIQAINDGDDNSSCGLYDQAMAAYQKAIFDSSLKNQESDERQLLEAYARYRIILLHVVRNKQQEAQTDYNILQTKFAGNTSGSAYAQLAKAFWDTYSTEKSIAAACENTINYATINTESVIEPIENLLPDSDRIGTGSNLAAQSELICPFR